MFAAYTDAAYLQGNTSCADTACLSCGHGGVRAGVGGGLHGAQGGRASPYRAVERQPHRCCLPKPGGHGGDRDEVGGGLHATEGGEKELFAAYTNAAYLQGNTSCTDTACLSCGHGGVQAGVGGGLHGAQAVLII